MRYIIALSILALLYPSCVMSGVGTPIFTEVTDIKAPFIEQFSDPKWRSRWIASEATKRISKEDEDKNVEEEFKFDGEWAVEEPTVLPGLLGDRGLVVKSETKHHAISAAFPSTIDPKDKTFVLQYEVKFQDDLKCGGAYLKLLTKQSSQFDPRKFDDKTPYTIMFGPDKCGLTDKVHFIFRHKNPKTGIYEEKHFTEAPAATISKTSTLYTLVVRPDNEFTIYINQEKAASGNLLKSFSPSVNPPKEIDDKTDKKPVDWVDEEKIPDPNAKKPVDWDESAPLYLEDTEAIKPEDWLENEPQYIDDPTAQKPATWNDEDDGDWIPPKVPNPKCQSVSGCGPWKRPLKKNPEYKGKWNPPMIDNPKYKGPWARRKVPNPDYFEDLHPHNFEPMAAIGFELWTLQANILFDNIFIGYSEQDAAEFAKRTWGVKYALEQAAQEKEQEQEQEKKQDQDSEESFLSSLRVQFEKLFEQFKRDPVTVIQGNLSVLIASVLGCLFFVFALMRLSSKKDKPIVTKKANKGKETDKANDEDESEVENDQEKSD